MFQRVVHVKVRWALYAGVASSLLQALLAQFGPSLPGWASGLSTALVGLLAGYAAPAADSQDPEATHV